MKPVPLQTILTSLESYSWREWIYISSNADINLETLCIVLDPDTFDVGDDGFTPLPAARHDMIEFLSVQDLLSVKENLELQLTQIDIDSLLQAVVHYFERDAFIVVEQ